MNHPTRTRRRPAARPTTATPVAFAVAAALWLGGVALAQSTTPLEYAEALRLADSGPTVQLALRALELAERQLAVTATPVRGELSAGYRWTSGERDPGVGDPIDLNDQGYDPIGLSLSFPALGLGPAGDAIARARADVVRAQSERAAAQRAARIEATNAFQNALRARRALALARAEADLTALESRAAELRAAAGAATAAEVARFATTEARARNAVAATAFEVEAADRALALVLGGPAGEPVGALPDPAALVAQAPEAAWARRSDVLAARLQVAETDRTADATLRDQLPSVGFSVASTSGDADRSLQWGASFDTRTLQPSVSLSYDPDSGVPGVGVDGTSRSLTVGVALRVPLDPTVGSALAAARIGRERALAQLELAQARAELDVDRRAFEFESASADAELAHAAAEQARADLAVREARFASGSISELAIARARLDADRAELDAGRAGDGARLAALRLLDALAIDPVPRTAPQE
ncbi:MAG: TolC family protein [Trueperaceae bacterium]